MTYNQLSLQAKAGIIKNYLKIRRYDDGMRIHFALATIDPEVEFNNGTCFISVKRATVEFIAYKQ